MALILVATDTIYRPLSEGFLERLAVPILRSERTWLFRSLAGAICPSSESDIHVNSRGEAASMFNTYRPYCMIALESDKHHDAPRC